MLIHVDVCYIYTYIVYCMLDLCIYIYVLYVVYCILYLCMYIFMWAKSVCRFLVFLIHTFEHQYIHPPSIIKMQLFSHNPKSQIHKGKLIWQWKNNHLKMYLLLKIVIFHCHVSFLSVPILQNQPGVLHALQKSSHSLWQSKLQVTIFSGTGTPSKIKLQNFPSWQLGAESWP